MSMAFIGALATMYGADIAIRNGSQYFWSQQQSLAHAHKVGDPFFAALGILMFVGGVIVLAKEFPSN